MIRNKTPKTCRKDTYAKEDEMPNREEAEPHIGVGRGMMSNKCPPPQNSFATKAPEMARPRFSIP